MKPNGHRPPGNARRPNGRYGYWRAVAAAPAVLGGLLVMLVPVALGRWVALFPLGWMACGAVLMTPIGERLAVRALGGFHRPSTVRRRCCSRHGRWPYD